MTPIDPVNPDRSPSARKGRAHGRITKEDIRTAGLRRWNGRQRITTDWLNLYQDTELCFPTGDILVYLRQQGQSSRGPAFRVHSSVLRNRGFQSLLNRCLARPVWHASKECLLISCTGCEKHGTATELYIPAPPTASVDAIFDHHITTRNFFAWLYDLPLAGRTLGLSLVALKERIDQCRDTKDKESTRSEIIAFAESQKYLDFRECADHALAALVLAENLRQEDLWTDAFAHAVGLSHRDINTSIEYSALKPKTQALLVDARLEMDVRLARASVSIETFFGDDLSGNFLGISQAARTHFDRFRSLLHAFYIEKYGFWPPAGFSSEASRYSIYKSLYADFRSLYHHLLNEDSSTDTSDISSAGGICTMQNIQAFDARHGFETLPKPLPRIPTEPPTSTFKSATYRPRSWNPILQKRMDRETKKSMRVQALIDASNRDMNLMTCPLVRKYSEFEARSVMDDNEQVSWIDGRKVRWILIYAILQTLISIMAAPKLVRNTEGLSYSLCCHLPKGMPWDSKSPSEDKTKKELVPDINYLHNNSSTSNLSIRSIERKLRRLSLPSRSSSAATKKSIPRSESFRKLLSKTRKGSVTVEHPPMPPLPARPFCEILVHGYGNGLNEVDIQNKRSMTFPTIGQIERRNSLVPSMDDDANTTALPSLPLPLSLHMTHEIPSELEVPHSFPLNLHMPHNGPSELEVPHSFPLNLHMPHDGPSELDVPALSPTSSTSVSRETSNASTILKTLTKEPEEIVTPTGPQKTNMLDLIEVLKASSLAQADGHFYDEIEGLPGAIHINTRTWDEILG